MKITLEMHGNTYIIDEQGDDLNANELIEAFTRLMVVATYPPSVIIPADGGRFECEYKEDEC